MTPRSRGRSPTASGGSAMPRRAVVLSLSLVSLALFACGEKAPDPAKPAPASGTPRAPAANAGGYGYTAQLGADLDKKVGDAIAKGRKQLLTQRDEATGSWGKGTPTTAGFTALATLAVIASTPRDAVSADPTIGK